MALVEVGRLCIKKYGRDAGSKAVITKIIDRNFVKIVSEKRAKERRCNIKHLELLNEKIDPSDRNELNKALGIEAKV
ncbi:MAG: hypothetical protein QXF41_02455 [Candidatus Micrarchaeaceae archaeon]